MKSDVNEVWQKLFCVTVGKKKCEIVGSTQKLLKW